MNQITSKVATHTLRRLKLMWSFIAVADLAFLGVRIALDQGLPVPYRWVGPGVGPTNFAAAGYLLIFGGLVTWTLIPHRDQISDPAEIDADPSPVRPDFIDRLALAGFLSVAVAIVGVFLFGLASRPQLL